MSGCRIALFQRWPDLPKSAAIKGYTLDEVGAEKLRCVAERLQCRDLYDLHELINTASIDPIELWHRYLHKAENDVIRGRQRTSPQDWLATFERRMPAYRDRWENELGNYLPGMSRHFATSNAEFAAPLVRCSKRHGSCNRDFESSLV
jgi:Nucleotidyl transferase AbiEii toxin, Type IV TA system